jgi:hypothetical protein
MTDTIACAGVVPEAGARANVEARGTQTSFPGDRLTEMKRALDVPVGPH